MRWLLAVALTAVVAAACGARGAVQQTPAQVAAGLVYVNGAAGSLLVVESGTGRITRTLPAGTPAPDWSRLYRLAGTAVDVVDPLDGRFIASHPVPAWAGAVRTSPDGRWLVFTPAGAEGRFQVQDAVWAAAPVNVTLPGSFTFDAISNDGQRLYLLEWLGAGRYQVRMFDLGKGQLAPYVIADKSEIGQPMSGEALAGYATRDGAMQLTLYQRSAKGQAFVHALPLTPNVQFAFCVDLPGPAAGWAFVAAPDGRRFFAVNPADGRVVEVWADSGGPPGTLGRRLAGLPAAQGGQLAAAVSPDGSMLYLGAGSQVVAVDTTRLTVSARRVAGLQVASLAVAPDGATVYAVAGADRLLRLDPHSLKVAGEVTVEAPLGTIVRTA